MDSGAIEAEGVGFAYGETVGLEEVSLSIPSGSVTALLGPNGAGKTTFVRLATGVLTPDSGRITVFGSAPRSLERERLGVLPQAFDPPERLTPGELLRYYAGLYERAREPGRLLEDLGLDDVAHRRYHRLSGGERRRTCLAIALTSDPDLLVLDEPTAAIDPAGKRDVWATLPELVRDGTILLTTHDMREAERLADRVAFFAEGELVTAGPAESIVSDHLGGRRLVLETDRPSRLRTSLGRGEVGADALVVDGVDPDDLPETIASAFEADATITAVHWERPPLEDLFMELGDEVGDRG